MAATATVVVLGGEIEMPASVGSLSLLVGLVADVTESVPGAVDVEEVFVPPLIFALRCSCRFQ